MPSLNLETNSRLRNVLRASVAVFSPVTLSSSQVVLARRYSLPFGFVCALLSSTSPTHPLFIFMRFLQPFFLFTFLLACLCYVLSLSLSLLSLFFLSFFRFSLSVSLSLSICYQKMKQTAVPASTGRS